MKKQVLILFATALLIGCNSVKKTQEAINKGDYNKAIDIAIQKLKKDKTNKDNQPYVQLLEEAFKKSVKRDQEKISFLKQEANPENLVNIYNVYLRLHERQEKIKPLLPLPNITRNGNARFSFENYDTLIINAKTALTSYLYGEVKELFSANNKYDYRRAYEDLKYIERLFPNYKDTRSLIKEARVKGIDYVFVNILNETEKVVPKRLEADLLNFDTYGLNDLWTVYHSSKDSEIKYDFSLVLSLRVIEVSPEQVREKQLIKEKQIKDGYKFLLDSDGNQVKDSLGKKIKIDKLVNIRCQFDQFTQFKSAIVSGQVSYVDFYTQQTIKVFPISSEFVFEHVYANSIGDKRALKRSFLRLLKMKSVSFPSNEQMIYDTGMDLKLKLKAIISRNKFIRQ